MGVMLWEEDVGWGSGSTMQTAAAAGLRADFGLDDTTLLQGIMEASSQAMRKTHTFDLDEYVGNQGAQGPAGPKGLPGLPGLGTSYVPRTVVPSGGYNPPRNKPYHPNDVPGVPYYGFGIIWSQVASVQVYYRTIVDCAGWAKFINDSAGSRTLMLWLMYRRYSQGDPTGPGPDNATLISDYVSETIEAGKEKMIRIKGYVEPDEFGYIDLYVRIDTYSGEEVRAPANHYGISGIGTWPRT